VSVVDRAGAAVIPKAIAVAVIKLLAKFFPRKVLM
jgi:hypothetical protein